MPHGDILILFLIQYKTHFVSSSLATYFGIGLDRLPYILGIYSHGIFSPARLTCSCGIKQPDFGSHLK
jgi:hypothetical protein